MPATQQTIGRAVFWSMAGRSGRFLLGLASSVIVVRGLGDYDYGVLSLVRTILAFVVIVAGAGLGKALLKFLPTLSVKRSAAEARRLAGRVLMLQTFAWLVVVLVFYLVRGRMEELFSIEGLGKILVAAVVLAVVELYFTILSQILNAHYDTAVLGLANVTAHAVYIAGLLALMPRFGVIGVIVAAAVGSFVAGCMLIARVKIHFSEGETEGGESVGYGRLFRYSLPFAAIGILNVIVWRQSETLFLAHYQGAKVTGYFDLAYRIPQTMLEFVPGTVWPIIMAGFSEAYARDAKSILRAVEKYYKALFLLCAPICVFGAVAGGRMIVVLFGDQMAPAADPARLFFLIFTVSFFATPLSMSLYVLEKSFANMVVYLFLAAVNIGLDLILIPRYGLPGAVAPVAIVIFVSPFIYHRVLARYLSGISVPFTYIARCFLASSPLLLMLPFLEYIDGPLELTAAAVIALILTTIGFKAVRVLGKEEADMLSSVPVPMLGRVLRFISS